MLVGTARLKLQWFIVAMTGGADTSQPPRFPIFLPQGRPTDSPASLRAERQRIHEYGQRSGANAVWVDGIIEPSRGITDPFEAIDDFFYKLEQSKLYLALVAAQGLRPGSANQRRYRAAPTPRFY